MVGINQEFEEDEPRISDGKEPIQLSLFLTLDGFEGPIDVLLSLAREQKVDFIIAAIRRGLLDTLITDEITAKFLLKTP